MEPRLAEACLVCPLTKSSPKRLHTELVELSTMSDGSTLRPPHPLDLLLAAFESPPIQLATEILALSKMNWNNTQFDGGWPITLRAAKQVAAILRQCSDEAAVQARYAYYM